MKLLYFTDTHIRGTSPQSRLDDFPNTLKEKFIEINDIIRKENIDFVLHGGDLFDRPDVSISVVSEFSKLLMDIPVPIYMISGNHDIFGHNPKTINRSIVGLLEELGIINLIKDGEVVLLEKNNIILQLTGQGYIYDIDEKDKRDYYKVKSVDPSADYSIHMVHGMLLDKPFIKGVPHTLIDDIKDTVADITLAGHYHSGFNEAIIDNKYFINPGSIARVSNSINEINRKPQVVIIDLSESIKIDYKTLKTGKDGKKVLDRTVIEDNIYKRERMHEFKQNIDSALNFDRMDINELIIDVSLSEQVDEKVKKEALKRISEIQMKDVLGD